MQHTLSLFLGVFISQIAFFLHAVKFLLYLNKSIDQIHEILSVFAPIESNIKSGPCTLVNVIFKTDIDLLSLWLPNGN